MNAVLAASSRHSRDTIMARLAAVLRDSDASTTNIESVIAQAGVQPREISAEFGGNRELLVAMVSQLADGMSEPLTSGATPAELKPRLLDFGQRVTNIYATSHLRGLYRIAITESIRHTGLGRDFHEAGPEQLTQRLADFLQSAQAEDVLGAGDPHVLASHLLASLRASLEIASTNAAADATYVQDIVDLFLHGIDARRQTCRT